MSGRRGGWPVLPRAPLEILFSGRLRVPSVHADHARDRFVFLVTAKSMIAIAG